MRVDWFTLRVLFLILVLGIFLEFQSESAVLFFSSVRDLQEHVPPLEFFLDGNISNVHFSNGAFVFELENEGKITCYHRHPPSSFFPFNKEYYRVHARLEQTPKGLLCVVKEMVFLSGREN